MRKTKDVWIIECNYGYGWDEACREETWKDAQQTYREYVENVDAWGVGRTRMNKKRVPINA